MSKLAVGSLASLLLVGCQFGVDASYIELHSFGCSTSEDCAEGFECRAVGEAKRCQPVALEDPKAPDSGCVDLDGDGWFVGPEFCLRCPSDAADCEADPDDKNPDVYPDAVEQCDGVDNDGDGLADQEDDDYVATNCPFQVGACKGAHRPCGGTTGGLQCDAQVYAAHNSAYSVDEVCGDGIDNDCDGSIETPGQCQ